MAQTTLQKANALLASRKYSEAEGLFRQAMLDNQFDVLARQGLAKALSRQGRHIEVINSLQVEADRLASPALDKEVACAAQVLAVRGIAMYADLAVRLYSRALCIKPDPVSYYYLGALYLEQLKRPDLAIPALRRSLELDPGSATVESSLNEALKALPNAGK